MKLFNHIKNIIQKNGGKALAFSACVMALSACSDEMLTPGENDANNTPGVYEPLYFTLNMQPTGADGTRAGELTTEREEAAPVENGISEMKVVLALLGDTKTGGSADYYFPAKNPENTPETTQTFTVIAYADIYPTTGTTFTPDANGVVTVKGELDKNAMENYLKSSEDVGTDGADDVYIFVIANSKNNPQVDRPVLGRNVQRQISAVANGNALGKDMEHYFPKRKVLESLDNGFLMTNDQVYTTKIEWDEIKKHTDSNNPYPLTSTTAEPVKIHRVAARLDVNYLRTRFAFVEGENESQVISPTGTSKSGEGDEIESSIIYSTELPENTKYILTIDGFAVANESLDYMLFQETGYPNAQDMSSSKASSDSDGVWNFLYQEKELDSRYSQFTNGTLYVRDPKGFSKIADTSNKLFYQPLSKIDTKKTGYGTHSNSFYFSGINKLDLTVNNGATEQPDVKYTTYHYVLPNAIHDKDKQLKKNTTAIIYRARIEDGNNGDTFVENAAVNGDDLFAYGNNLLGNFSDFKDKADKYKSDPTTYSQYQLANTLYDHFFANYISAGGNEGDVNSIKSQIATLSDEISWLNLKKSEYAEELKTVAGVSSIDESVVDQKVFQLYQQKTEYESQLDEEEDSDLIAQIKKSIAEIDDLLSRIESLQGLIASIDAQIEENESNLEDLRGELQIAENNLYGNLVKDKAKLRAAAKDAGIRTYQAVNIGTTERPEYAYYCYYYYWIRHNNNNDPEVMGDMEFAIVRNYVYKLSVSKIFDLGYPENPGDDPDPEDPDEPVEGKNMKLLIETKVMPWGKRYDDNITLY